VNFLFLVEGAKTEPKVYKAWLSHLFPGMKFVRKPEDMINNSCRIISGHGYPNIFSTSKCGDPSPLEACLLDIFNFKNVDYFFICLDSEDESYKDRYQEISSRLKTVKTKVGLDNYQSTEFHIIVQDCCIETWALGNSEIPNENQSRGISSDFQLFHAYYNILVNNPEEMQNDLSQNTYPTKRFSTKARFHGAYLKEYLSEFGLSYSKKNPSVIADKKYLDALMKRCNSTDHLSSLKNLLDLWQDIRNQHA
jgi:hypothetical protein